MKQNKTHVYFRVFNVEPPELFSELTGLTPTKVWRAGDLRFPTKPKSQMTHKQSGWELQSALPLETDWEEHVEALLAILETRAEQVQRVTAQFESGIQCAIYYYDGCNPGVHLSRLLVARLSALRVYVDFDIYCLSGAQ